MCHHRPFPAPYFEVPLALNAAHIENEYKHEFDRPAEEIVCEIHDWSGLKDFDPDSPVSLAYAARQVERWRHLRCKYCDKRHPDCGCGARDYYRSNDH